MAKATHASEAIFVGLATGIRQKAESREKGIYDALEKIFGAQTKKSASTKSTSGANPKRK